MMNKERVPIYKIGDKVRIVNYGHRIWEFDPDSKTGSILHIDLSPEIVGKEGIVDIAKCTQGVPQYAITGIKGKHAWYDEEQLELVDLKKELKEDFITIVESAAAKQIKEDDEIIRNIPGTNSKSFWITVEKDFIKNSHFAEDTDKTTTVINMKLRPRIKYNKLLILELRELIIEVRSIRNAESPRYEKQSKLLESLVEDIAFMYGDDLLSTLSCIDTLLRNEIVRRFIDNELN